MKKSTLTIIAVLGISYSAIAQTSATHGVDITINSVSMIRATNSAAAAAPANSAISVGGPIIPGNAPAITLTNQSALHLQYTSIKASVGTPRTIKVALTTGTIPAGFAFSATAGAPAGTGDTGSSSGIQTISGTPTTIITGIGSGYTGIGATDGSNVTYAATITDVADLIASASTTLTVTYTLSNE